MIVRSSWATCSGPSANLLLVLLLPPPEENRDVAFELLKRHLGIVCYSGIGVGIAIEADLVAHSNCTEGRAVSLITCSAALAPKAEWAGGASAPLGGWGNPSSAPYRGECPGAPALGLTPGKDRPPSSSGQATHDQMRAFARFLGLHLPLLIPSPPRSTFSAPQKVAPELKQCHRVQRCNLCHRARFMRCI